MYNIIVIGPAGSGKSTLTASFGGWLEENGHRVGYINLDPGADSPPYNPTFDIRTVVTLEEIMLKEKLAPNGALIRAAEIIESSLPSVVEKFESAVAEADIRLIDTPGQMEVFLFRNLGPSLVSLLQGRILTLDLIEPGLLRNETDLITLRLLGLLTEIRLGVPSIEVLNKSDLYGSVDIKKIEEAIPETGMRACGLSEELNERLQQTVQSLRKCQRMISVSSRSGAGMDELYKELGECFCSCGDLS